jgi:hypothetical protein
MALGADDIELPCGPPDVRQKDDGGAVREKSFTIKSFVIWKNNQTDKESESRRRSQPKIDIEELLRRLAIANRQYDFERVMNSNSGHEHTKLNARYLVLNKRTTGLFPFKSEIIIEYGTMKGPQY